MISGDINLILLYSYTKSMHFTHYINLRTALKTPERIRTDTKKES